MENTHNDLLYNFALEILLDSLQNYDFIFWNRNVAVFGNWLIIDTDNLLKFLHINLHAFVQKVKYSY